MLARQPGRSRLLLLRRQRPGRARRPRANGGPHQHRHPAVPQPVRLSHRPGLPQLRRAGPGLPGKLDGRRSICCSRATWKLSSAAWAAPTWPWRPGKPPASPTATAAWTSSWPSCPARSSSPPSSTSSPREINLGQLQVGEDRELRAAPDQPGHAAALRLGQLRRLHLADPRRSAGARRRSSSSSATSWSFPVHVRGKQLRAGNKPLEGRLVVESNGGTATVIVRAEVPVKPFPDGVLAGARSPRQIAEKAKAAAQGSRRPVRERRRGRVVQGQRLDLPGAGARRPPAWGRCSSSSRPSA